MHFLIGIRCSISAVEWKSSASLNVVVTQHVSWIPSAASPSERDHAI